MVSSGGRTRLNRRLIARLVCLLTVRYRLGKGWHPATVLDLSPTGCRLRVGEELERDASVRVLFERPLRDGSSTLSLETGGTVMWARREGLSYQAGIQFAAEPEGLGEIMQEIQ